MIIRWISVHWLKVVLFAVALGLKISVASAAIPRMLTCSISDVLISYSQSKAKTEPVDAGGKPGTYHVTFDGIGTKSPKVKGELAFYLVETPLKEISQNEDRYWLTEANRLGATLVQITAQRGGPILVYIYRMFGRDTDDPAEDRNSTPDTTYMGKCH